MSLVEEAVRSRVIGYAGVTALIGTRMYPVKLPQDVTYPALTYAVIAAPREHLMVADAGVIGALIQVSVWAETMATAKALAIQVAASLNRFHGTVLGVVIQETWIENESDGWEDEAKVYHIPIDVRVNYEG